MSHREVVATTYGGPEALELRTVEDVAPSEGEVVVEVRAIGVNAWDVKSYGGTVGDDPSALPLRLGAECAGVVVESRSDGVPVGSEVVVHPASGTYADRVVVPATNALPKPSSLTWEQAAGLLLTGTAAAHLVEATRVAPGDTVLLHGAAGGVGLIAVQLARQLGARVLGTARPDDHALLERWGVEPFDFRGDVRGWLAQAAPDGVDAVLDVTGAPTVLDLSLEVARDRDRVATLNPGPAALELGVVQLGFGEGADPGQELRAAARTRLLAGAEEGWLEVVVADTFALADAADAHRLMVAEHAPGKIVLVP